MKGKKYRLRDLTFTLHGRRFNIPHLYYSGMVCIRLDGSKETYSADLSGFSSAIASNGSPRDRENDFEATHSPIIEFCYRIMAS